jgi:serine/threonine-protein kinase
MRFALLLTALLSFPVLAEDYFGAIAYSAKSGAQGWSNNHPSREAAEKAALKACRKHAQDCKAVVWFQNGCGALAVSSKVYGWGWGTTQTLADAQAIKACSAHAKHCQVTRRLCTVGSS